MDMSSKRQPVIPISTLRQNVDDTKESIDNLLSENPTLFENTQDLVALSKDVKTLNRKFQQESHALSDKLLGVGANSEAQEIRETRITTIKECNALIRLINAQLEKMCSEEVSNIDIGSLYSEQQEVQEFNLPKQPIVAEKTGTLADIIFPDTENVFQPSLNVDNSIQHAENSKQAERVQMSTTKVHDYLTNLNQVSVNNSANYYNIGAKPKYGITETVQQRSTYKPNVSTNFRNNNANVYLEGNPHISTTRSYVPPTYLFSNNQHRSANMPNYAMQNNNLLQNNPQIGTYSPYRKEDLFICDPNSAFSGEPHKFNSWLCILKNRMKNLTLDAIDIITILSAHTTGEPHKMIENYLAAIGDNPQDTLDLIWETLHKRFGSTVQVASELKKKLMAIPQIKQPNIKGKLIELSDLCNIILANQRNNAQLSIYDIASEQRIIWQKFPQYLQNSWCSFAHNFMSNQDRDPPLSVLVDFLVRHTEEACNPNFEKLDCFEDKTSKPRTTRVLHTNNTDKESPSKCVFHNTNSHSVVECHTFNKLQYYEKINFAKSKKLCFNCLENHLASACDSNVKCDKCQKNHLTIMHNYRNENRTNASNQEKNSFNSNRTRYQNSEQNQTNRKTTNENYADANKIVKDDDNVQLCSVLCGNPHTDKNCSKTLLVDVYHKNNPSKKLTCYVIVDEHSNSSYIDPKAIEKLGVTGTEHDYHLTTMTGYRTKQTGMIIEGLQIKGVKESKSYNLPPLYTHGGIPNCKREVATPAIVRAHEHISHLNKYFIDVDPAADVCLLIGRDSGYLMKTKCFGDTFPFAHHTPLGWALVGGTCLDDKLSSDATTFRIHQEHLTANKSFSTKDKSLQISECFEEHVDDECLGPSQEDQQFLEIMEKNVHVNSKGYITMPLPFKNNETMLPNNKLAVYCRTKNMLQRLKCDKSTLEQCLQSMNKNITAGHVDQIPNTEVEHEPGKSWWLPIFVVFHPKKQKPRLVFDSSATFKGISLNNQLLQGPDNNNKLLGVLLRFRTGETGFSSDIEAMYYNFHLTDSDANYVKFFWFENNDPTKTIVEYRGKVHLFGNKPSPAIAHYGLKYAVSNATNVSEKVKSFLENNFYVDDGLGGARTPQDAIQTLEGAISTLKQYNIRLHKIVSNSSEVLGHFPQSEISETTNKENGVTHSVLGILWDTNNDELSIDVNIPERPFTKRGMLSIVGSLYDPLGIIGPVTLKGKCIQREVMINKDPEESKVDWDDPLPIKLQDEWNKWKDSLTSLDIIKVPRSFYSKNFGSVKKTELHVFADASEKAIAAVAYLRVVNTENIVNVSYVMSKTKLVPRSAMSIPRAELCAALEASFLMRDLTKELMINIDNAYMYTDSMVVLGYLKNTEKKFSNYVTRRVRTILKLTDVDQWSYIATDLNPADIGSRCHSVQSLLETSWLKGPKFLHYPTTMPNNVTVNNVSLPEEKENVVLKTDTPIISPLHIILQRTSKLNRAINITQTLFKFVYKMTDQARMNLGIPTAVRNCEISRETALIELILCTQKSYYLDLYHTLMSGNNIKDHKLASLNPFLDSNNIIRVGGRLRLSSLPPHQKHPILLPAKHPLTSMVLHHYHNEVKHQGRYITHGALREAGFHVENGSKIIKNLIYHCVTCRKLRGRVSSQLMADLPACRSEETPPFHHTGVDVFGPFTITDGKSTRQRAGTRKTWALICVCMVSRAIHIEPLPGLDTSTLRNAIRRFISIRGTCKHFYSDCGTNFVGSENQEIQVSMSTLKGEFELRECFWHFNVPHASHHGGSWERKIGSVRRILESTILHLRGRLLSRDEFATLLSESMAIVNNTPMWDVSADPNDSPPVTPAQLLTLKDTADNMPLDEFTEKDILYYGQRRWRRIQYLSNCFWEQWRKHYLLSLQERSKWIRQNRNLEIGDLVLLKDKTLKRNNWPYGIITGVKKSNDHLVRSITLDIIAQKGQNITRKSYIRPISEVVLVLPNQM